MKREEAIVILDGFKHNPLFNEQHFEALDMAISALSENKGEWTEWKGRNGRYNGIPICSNCNTGFPVYAKDYKFCPECGADMRGKADEQT